MKEGIIKLYVVWLPLAYVAHVEQKGNIKDFEAGFVIFFLSTFLLHPWFCALTECPEDVFKNNDI